ncbi:MAG: hypothetical protein QOH88_3227 [Verrucomicrobiota bacterium]|jgi:hypothetical protein
MEPLRAISGPTPFKDLYDSVKSTLPNAKRLRLNYLVNKMYTRSIRNDEVMELRAFAGATARVPININLPTRQNGDAFRKRNRSSARLDLEQCARDGLLW